AHEAEAAYRVPVERRHRAPSKPKPRACRRKRLHRKYSMHSAGSAPSSTPNSTAYTAIAGTQASASSMLPGEVANRWSTATTRADDSAASGANIRNASTTVRSASPKAVQLRASRSTFSHHAVIHHDASPAAAAAAGATPSEAPALRCHDASPAPLRKPMTTYALTASAAATAALVHAKRLRVIRARPRAVARAGCRGWP